MIGGTNREYFPSWSVTTGPTDERELFPLQSLASTSNTVRCPFDSSNPAHQRVQHLAPLMLAAFRLSHSLQRRPRLRGGDTRLLNQLRDDLVLAPRVKNLLNV